MLNIFVDGEGQPQYVPVGNIGDLGSVDAAALGGVPIGDLEKAHEKQVQPAAASNHMLAHKLMPPSRRRAARAEVAGWKLQTRGLYDTEAVGTGCVAGEAPVGVPQRGRRVPPRQRSCSSCQGGHLAVTNTIKCLAAACRNLASECCSISCRDSNPHPGTLSMPRRMAQCSRHQSWRRARSCCRRRSAGGHSATRRKAVASSSAEVSVLS